ncbi:hypothetical protein BV20DRAFT_118773 [Pilatotrama ljubarskyi]|nr:hypothetical protein BV20DRAFT_118773 [Pilatotrama ljubarskyi]
MEDVKTPSSTAVPKASERRCPSKPSCRVQTLTQLIPSPDLALLPFDKHAHKGRRSTDSSPRPHLHCAQRRTWSLRDLAQDHSGRPPSNSIPDCPASPCLHPTHTPSRSFHSLIYPQTLMCGRPGLRPSFPGCQCP